MESAIQQMLKSVWDLDSPQIENRINETLFKTVEYNSFGINVEALSPRKVCNPLDKLSDKS